MRGGGRMRRRDEEVEREGGRAGGWAAGAEDIERRSLLKRAFRTTRTARDSESVSGHSMSSNSVQAALSTRSCPGL
eukprot:3252516-Pleurochrysis_carterae.AAC.5